MHVDRLDRSNAAVMLIDLQERLVPVMDEKTTLVRRCARLVDGANILKVPVLVTEQYPRGLGATVQGVSPQIDAAVCIDEKTRFSACSPSILRFLEKFETRSVIVAGVEAHVCVLQTCLDLIERGYCVAVCFDAVSSRRPIDKQTALSRLVHAGALPTTVESVLLEMVSDAGDAAFRQIRSVIASKDT